MAHTPENGDVAIYTHDNIKDLEQFKFYDGVLCIIRDGAVEFGVEWNKSLFIVQFGIGYKPYFIRPESFIVISKGDFI